MMKQQAFEGYLETEVYKEYIYLIGKAYMEMGDLNQEEDEDYIKGMLEKIQQ